MTATSETICSVSTAPGIGAIAVIRVSGSKAFPIVEQLFKKKSAFTDTAPHVAKFGEIFDGESLIDQVVFVKFAAPHSYDGEDMVEISCHGSRFIQQKILEMLLQRGCRMAEPGEFTLRAFMNGKMDLPQAEAVGDLIDSQSESAHRLAVNQLKGGFSRKIADLRDRFIQLAALLELELDFSEEEVEFADRKQFIDLLAELRTEVKSLVRSFHTGNALKNGIPVAIAGKPNVGKSTLLNALLNDDRAIVSDIPGTTRDTIEDTLTLGGTLYRFIDTAGIRHSDDTIENSGIQRSFRAMENADIILYMVDAVTATSENLASEIQEIRDKIGVFDKKIILILNKIDKTDSIIELPDELSCKVIGISAKERKNLEAVTEALTQYVAECSVSDDTLLTNARHYDLMVKIADDIVRIEQGLTDGLPTDLVAIDVHSVLDKLGLLTGTITDNDVLNTIFGKFCIGK
ncbi:MAG: tRNA uridine-5-carboxymethylaminomethyl(34) synthesis GTPase MnmE [Bacteroidales bacterium]|nr:tRNA uridine-5-carboxymethylaminomethyl(34) synthesis GTPase MnmE [Bacteroidales bacterium]